MPRRIAVTLEEPVTAIRLWIRASARHIWKRDELYESLKAEKRHDPSKAPDPQGDLAAYLIDRFGRQDWQVTRPKIEFPGGAIAERLGRRAAGQHGLTKSHPQNLFVSGNFTMGRRTLPRRRAGGE